MQPTIQLISSRKLVGQSVSMSLNKNLTLQLWQGFMSRRKEIQNTIGNDLFSLREYGADYDFINFDFDAEFQKWAAVEVEEFVQIPEGMKAFLLDSGMYAVFQYRGINTDPSIFRYIYQQWLPASGYALDEKPHFEILGAKYRNDDPESEEEIWVPVKEVQ